MSDFNAAINLGIRITEALTGIQKVEKQISQLATKAAGITLDIGGKAATGGVKLATRNVRDYINTLGTLDKKLGGLGGRLKDVAKAFDFGGKTVVGVAGINALAAALSKLPGYLTGGTSGLQSFASTLQGLTSPINSVVEGLQAIGPTGLAAAGGIATATAAFMAFGPGIRKATKDINDFKNSFKLGSLDVTQDLISEKTLRDALRSATSEQKKLSAGTAEYTTKTEEVVALQKELTGELRRQEIIYKRVNAEQLAIGETVRRNIRASQASREGSGFSDAESARTNRRAIEGALRRQGLVEKEAIGPASQLGSLDADVERLRFIKQQGEEKAKQIAQEEQQRLSLLNKIQSDELTGSKRIFDEKLRQINLLGDAQLNQIKAANQAELDGFDRKLRETEQFRQSYSSPAGPGNAAGEQAFRKQQSIFGNIDKSTTDAVNALTDVNRLGKQLDANKSETARRLEDLEFQKKLDNIEEEAKAQLKADRLTNSAAERDFDRRLKAREAKRQKNARLGENLALGAGFPLLFGAGPGGVAGGVGGALVGGDGFGLQILFSALGTQLDELGAATTKTAQDLDNLLGNVEAINESFNLFNRESVSTIQRLEELGRAQEAANIVRKGIVDVIGEQGLAQFNELSEASRESARLVGELGIRLQAALAGPIAAFLRLVNSILSEQSGAVTTAGTRLDIRNGLSSKDAAQLEKDISKVFEDTKFEFDPNIRKDKITKLYEEAAKKAAPAPDAQLTPAQQLAAAQVSLDNAEKEAALKKQGIDLERQVTAFRRSNEETIYGFKEKVASIERQNIDLRRSVENQIFNQRQAIAKQESDNIRKQQQVEIDRQDLALSGSRTFTNAPGEDLANSLSDAVRQYVKTRAEGEADLQQKERNFTLETIQLEKKQKDFELQVQQKIDAIKRTITQYERSVTKYKLDTQITIDQITRATVDYQLARTKERIRLEEDNAKRIQATDAAAEMVRSGNYGGGSAPGGGMFPMTSPRGPRNLFGRSYHHGQDYATPMGTALSTKVGGTVTDAGTAGGYGKFVEVLLDNGMKGFFAHLDSIALKKGQEFDAGDLIARTGNTGDSTGPHLHSGTAAISNAIDKLVMLGGNMLTPPAERAAAQTMPAAPAAPAAPGVTDVSALTAQSAQLNQNLISSKQSMLEIEASAKELADAQAVKTLSDTIAQSIQSVQAPLDTLLQTQQARFEDEKSYARLLQEGIAPAVAKQTVEIERQVATQLQILDTLISRAELELASLQAKELETTELENQLELLKAQKGIIEGKGQSAVSAAATNEDGKKIRDYMNQLQGELNDTDAMIVSLAQTIESELASAMSSAITGLVDGTVTAQEAFADMFANIGKAFIDMATQMIAKALIMKALGILTGGAGGGGQMGGGGYFDSITGLGTAGPNYGLADGGFVTSPTQATVGEGGNSEYVIPQNKMNSSMQRWNSGMRGDGVINGAEPTGGYGEGVGVGADAPSAINIEGGILQFNDTNYIKQEQVPAIIKQASKAGEAKALRRLQMSSATRKQLGI